MMLRRLIDNKCAEGVILVAGLSPRGDDTSHGGVSSARAASQRVISHPLRRENSAVTGSPSSIPDTRARAGPPYSMVHI